MNIFEQASRTKLRFAHKGQISVEDLWDLSVTQLDNMYRVFNGVLKSKEEESLLDTVTNEDTVLSLQIEIIKHVVATKLSRIEDQKQRVEKHAQKAQLLALLEAKKVEGLSQLSEAELLAKIEAL